MLIKPSHYDDDGYVIQWARSWIPSNSLACVYGLARDAAERRILGDDVGIDIQAYDETNRILPIARLVREMVEAGTGLVCLIGVQSNQFPRAVDIARPFPRGGRGRWRSAGFTSPACLAMLPELPADIAAARDMGISLFAGEAEEGRLDRVIADAHAGTLEPIYNHMDDLPGLQGTVPPFLPAALTERYVESLGAFDAGRGCPFQLQLLHDHQRSRAASPAGATPTISRRWCARRSNRAYAISSSQTTISPATGTGRRSSTG